MTSVSNVEFLKAAAGADFRAWKDRALWVTAFQSPAEDARNADWNGWALNGKGAVPDRGNTYYSIAVLKDGARRRKDSQVGLLAIVADDVNADALSTLPLRPSYILETSPGNHHVGYFVQDPCNVDLKLADRILKALVAARLASLDKSGNNRVRYVRLPQGVNNKARVIAEFGEPFSHRLLEWNPGTRYRLESVAAAFNVAAGGTDDGADNERDHRPAHERWGEDVAAILAGAGLHDHSRDFMAGLRACAVPKGVVLEITRALMLSSPRRRTEPQAWQARFDDLPRCLEDAEKYAGAPPDDEPKAQQPALLGAASFANSMAVPAWLVKGVLQRSYLYGITALTQHGKTAVALVLALCVAMGIPFAGRRVRSGRVLFLAGENPENVKERLIATAQLYGIPLDRLEDRIIFRPGADRLLAITEPLKQEASAIGEFALVVIDTSAAFYSYENEDDNVDSRQHGQDARRFIDLPGKPAVLMACHPVKNAGKDQLIPRGGSGLINELDGNLTLWLDGETCSLHHNKVRGPAFDPIALQLRRFELNGVKDEDGDPVFSVAAAWISPDQQAELVKGAEADENKILRALLANENATLRDLAEAAGFFDGNGNPARYKAGRILERLERDKLVKRVRRKFHLTDIGRAEAAS